MEWIILFAIILAYSSLSEKIKRISNESLKTKKEFPSLKDLIGKIIEIEDDEHYYETATKGILKYYDETWIAIESKNKKKKTEVNYFRISNISSINIIDE